MTDTAASFYQKIILQPKEGVERSHEVVQGLNLSMVPNPTRATGQLTIQVPQAGIVRLAIYDPLGRIVKQLPDLEAGNAGNYVAELDLADLEEGVYMVRAESNGMSRSVQIRVIR